MSEARPLAVAAIVAQLADEFACGQYERDQTSACVKTWEEYGRACPECPWGKEHSPDGTAQRIFDRLEDAGLVVIEASAVMTEDELVAAIDAIPV